VSERARGDRGACVCRGPARLSPVCRFHPCVKHHQRSFTPPPFAARTVYLSARRKHRNFRFIDRPGKVKSTLHRQESIFRYGRHLSQRRISAGRRRPHPGRVVTPARPRGPTLGGSRPLAQRGQRLHSLVLVGQGTHQRSARGARKSAYSLTHTQYQNRMSWHGMPPPKHARITCTIE
jgi:hypothetical protein